MRDSGPSRASGSSAKLIEGVRRAGLPVELAVEGAATPLPSGIDVSAYRIVQEALTNAIKHAGPAHAQVRLCYLPDAVEVQVCDDGNGDGTPGGHGLIGMRERVAVFGGELETGPVPAGGFRVRASLPYEGSARCWPTIRRSCAPGFA